jgi:protein subunit release factor A
VSEKKLLFSLTRKDFEIQTFCTGGNGGQHRNAKQNGVRIIHPASGARGEHRDGRDQAQNKKQAFFKLAESKQFKSWHRMEVARRLGQLAEVDRAVDHQMAEANLKIEYAAALPESHR